MLEEFAAKQQSNLVGVEQPQPASNAAPAKPLIVNDADSTSTLVSLHDFWVYRELVYFLIWRDLKIRHKQTALGVSWVILQPLTMTIVFTIFLGMLAHVPSDNVPYLLLVYSGLMPWTFFSNAILYSGNSLITNTSNPPRVWQIVLSQLKLYLLLPRRIRGELLLADHWAHDRKRTVPMLSGAAMMVRREMIDQVGGFDERFQMYAEDNEWCLRIIRSGWRLMFDPAATVLHHGGQSAAQRWSQPERERVQMEAAYLFQQRVLPRWRLIANQIANYSIISAQVAWRAMRGIHSPKLDLQKEVHRENFKRALGLRGTAGKQSSS